MDCNKDEAMRAKEIAERKFINKDFEGAKKFAIKAQTLYPCLDGISQMLATFDVYISSSTKTNNETDWYKILGINPSADDETIKKHYKKLALTLHPDKNRSVGAEGAFQFISEALSVLSDKSRRALYDQKRNPEILSQKKTPRPTQVRKSPPAANGSYDFPKSEEKSDTFWTLCYKCKLQFEYLRLACNYHLICRNCSNSFLAFEMPAPSAYGVKRNSALKLAGSTGTSYDICRWTPFLFSGTPNVARSGSVAQKTYESAVREFEEALAAEKQDKDMKRKFDGSYTDYMSFAKKRKDVEESHGVMNLSRTEICNVLVNKARKVIRKKIREGEGF